MARESRFQKEVIDDLGQMFPGCIVLKTDPGYIQGFPDILVLYEDRWAALEVKASRSARLQPNQAYYVELLDGMSFSAIICPENKEVILDELQRSFQPNGKTRFSKRK